VSLVVVKCGGRVAGASASEILRLARGHDVVAVHGAGPQISAAMHALGLEVRFVGGRRVTDVTALAVVRRELVRVNEALCAVIGPRAIGLLGDEIGLAAERIEELGLVGEPLPSAPVAVVAALACGAIPVVAPLAEGPLNINADDAAAALAVGLGADRLLFLSDVPGVLRPGGVASAIGAEEADRLLAGGELEGGIVPKLHAAVRAARLGVAASIGETAVVA
jgi:acetylglutamate kinase